ncbi:unnamed protein product, partial [Meganyctiphanes norvegica]
GTWKWVDGQPISTDSSHFPWASGEPNNWPEPNGNEDCLLVNFAGGYNDVDCLVKRRYICEGKRSYFVGGSDAAKEGTWKWLNGEQISTESRRFPWAKGEPNNWPGHGDEDCLTITHGGFNDEACWIEHPFICEVV